MATNNPVNEVHSNDNQIFDNVDYQLSQEMHQEEHLDSDAETEIDDNTIPYHQYLLDTEAQNVPTEVSADTSDKVSMIAILTDLQTQLDGHAKEKILSEKKDLADSYLDEIVCLKNANKVARDMLQRFNMPTHTIPMLSKKPKAATADLHKDSSSYALCEDLRSACDREHTKVLELEAEVLKQQKMVIESEKRSTEGSCDQQALETDRIQLKDAITLVRIQNDGFKAENVNLKRHYEEL
ncbi:hypothetical protein Tco_0317591 [Tanacetum coccineum]